MADKKTLTLEEKAKIDSEQIKKENPEYYNSKQSDKDLEEFIKEVNANSKKK